MTTNPERGDTVRIHYVAKLADGKVFDTSPQDEPFEFTLGAKDILPELQNTIRKMVPGETKKLHLPPDKAFGKYDAGLVYQFPLSALPKGFQAEKGQLIYYENTQREFKQVLVKDISASFLVLDHNHPMAGKEVDYEITLVEIIKAED